MLSDAERNTSSLLAGPRPLSRATAITIVVHPLPSARASRVTSGLSRDFLASTHSHTRTTFHPRRRSSCVTSRSRATLRANFGSQNSRRLFGV
jgi:hypothetical protein